MNFKEDLDISNDALCKVPKKVIIWGIGVFWGNICNSINFEVYKRNIEVVAYVSKESRSYSRLDNKEVIFPSRIHEFEFDYIIVCTKNYYMEILKEAESLEIDSNKVINGKVFMINNFDFDNYIKIKESKISIISDSCLGGFIYNTLGLKFNSPFINIRISPLKYLKLLNNLEEYLKQPLLKECDNELVGNKNALCEPMQWEQADYPIALLGDDIKLHLIHNSSFDEQKEMWERRIKRVNYNNIIVMMIIDNDEIAERFDLLPIKNKIGFYYRKTAYKSIIYMKEWEDTNLRKKYGYKFRMYVQELCNDFSGCNSLDLLKMLKGETDFLLKK